MHAVLVYDIACDINEFHPNKWFFLGHLHVTDWKIMKPRIQQVDQIGYKNKRSKNNAKGVTGTH